MPLPANGFEIPKNPGRTELYEKKLTVAEFAAAMRVSKMSVYRLIDSGELPAYKVGRTIRIPERAAKEFLADAVVEPHEDSSGEVLTRKY